jgi:hypothetical protein
LYERATANREAHNLQAARQANDVPCVRITSQFEGNMYMLQIEAKTKCTREGSNTPQEDFHPHEKKKSGSTQLIQYKCLVMVLLARQKQV